MNVLSLFNGMGFGRMALDTLNIKVENYYSSEIDKYANQAAQALFPDTVQIGDVTKWREWDIDLGSIDLLIAGFPCQAWSMAGKMQGDSDPRGALVHDLIDIWKSINRSREAYGKDPVKFMFENVKMKKEFMDYINNLFGADPICINSALVSAQNRVRYYWTNICVYENPKDKGLNIPNILDYDGPYTFMSCNFIRRQEGLKCLRDDISGKAVSLSSMEYVKNGRQGDYFKWGDGYRKPTIRECARLQTVPEHHIDTLVNSGISNTQLYKMLGNGFTHDVITHIFKGLIK